MNVDNLYEWLSKKLLDEGIINDSILKSLEEEYISHASLFLDYLVSEQIVSSKKYGDCVEYKLENLDELKKLIGKKPRDSVSVNISPTMLVYSAPTSLLDEIFTVIDSHTDVGIITLEDAFYHIMDSTEGVLRISSPFIEWDGLMHSVNIFKRSAEKNINMKILTRGVLEPEKNASYQYLEKIKTLKKLYSIYDRYTTSPEAKIEIRDFTMRLTLRNASIHYEGIHQKMIIGDHNISYVGSGEVRAASFHTNGECGVLQTGSPAAFWADFFDVFWKSSKVISRDFLDNKLSITTG